MFKKGIQAFLFQVDAFLNRLTRFNCLEPCVAAFPQVVDVGDRERDSKPEVDEKGILYAVPISRRTIERRMWRRIGHPWFKINLKTNLKACHRCGHFHEAHTVCGHCYSKVKEVSEQIQTAAKESWKYDAVDRETWAKFSDDPDSRDSGMDKTHKIVEIPKPRPSFWPQNLLQKGHHPRD